MKTQKIVFSDTITAQDMEQMLVLRTAYENGDMSDEIFEARAMPILFQEAKQTAKNITTVLTLDSHPRFYRTDRFLYLTGVNLSIPASIAEQMSNAIKKEDEKRLSALINFWSWLAMNPSSESRASLYDTVTENGIQILECGLLLMYRRVVKVDGVDTSLMEWASKEYARLRLAKKTTQRKVFKNKDGYNLTEGEYLGFLPELKTSDDVYYTDNHTKTCRFYIGQEARMPRVEVDHNRRESCSTGFHVGAKGFVYSSFGDTPIACVVNPMDVVAVLPNEQGKTRTAAFTPIAILNRDAEWGNEVDIDLLVDIAHNKQVERMKELLATASIEDENNVIDTEFNVTMKDIDTIQLFGK